MDPSVLDSFAARALRVPMDELLTERRTPRLRRTRRNHERREH
ncbi:hypothetical protein ATJ97_2421 [Georgenia soli]|uniref:Uncharacterized protein n=1 Tax=Georgenia soli TaxID=638953 RepID=A0A2A9EMZ1_9MICO|nr:hypothetical protein [Georgenia soli]PFG39901.1 hypothetical protein ATJ97_2421 [Georgenia soli]